MSTVFWIPKIIAITSIPTLFLSFGLINASFNTKITDFLVSRLEEQDDDIGNAKQSTVTSSSTQFQCRVKGSLLIDNECELFHIQEDLTEQSPNLEDFKNATTSVQYADVEKYDFFKIKLHLNKLATIHHGYKTIIEVFKRSDDVLENYSTKPVARFKIEAWSEKNILRAYVNYFVVLNTKTFPTITKNVSTAKKDYFAIGEDQKNNIFLCSVEIADQADDRPSKQKKYPCLVYLLENNMINPKKINASKSSRLKDVGKITQVKPEAHYIVRLSRKYLLGSLKEKIIKLHICQDSLSDDNPQVFNMKLEHSVALKFKKLNSKINSKKPDIKKSFIL